MNLNIENTELYKKLDKFLNKNGDRLLLIGGPIVLFIFRQDCLLFWNKLTGREDDLTSVFVVAALLFGGFFAVIALITTLMFFGWIVVIIDGKRHKMTVLYRRQYFERTRLEAMRGIPEDEKGPVMKFYKREIGYPWFKFGYRSKKTLIDGEETITKVGVMYLSKRFDPKRFPALNDEHIEVPNALWVMFLGACAVFIVALCIILLKLS
jgi:hypothetical protein